MEVRGIGLIEDFCRIYRDAEGPLMRWLAMTRAAQWTTFPECRRTFPHADQVRVASGLITVFNIKGNHYRLIVAIVYAGNLVVIRRIMTHKEYNKGSLEGSYVIHKPIRNRARVADSYLACVRKFPLRPIRKESEYREAVEILGQLATREKLDAGQQDYLAALSHFVGDYESSIQKAPPRSLTPVESLQFLMEQHDMSTTELGRVVGSRGLASEILNGNRGMSKNVIHKLAKYFAVDPVLFLKKE